MGTLLRIDGLLVRHGGGLMYQVTVATPCGRVIAVVDTIDPDYALHTLERHGAADFTISSGIGVKRIDAIAGESCEECE